MTSGAAGQPPVKLQKATEIAFGAAFFFLPLSKALLFISLAIALLLFVASGGFMRALRCWRTLPWTVPAALLAALPLLSLAIHPHVDKPWSHLETSYYWLFALLTFLAASQMPILQWMRALLCGVFLTFCYVQLPMKAWWPLDPPSATANYILYSQFLAIGVLLLSILYKFDSSRRNRGLYVAGMICFFIGVALGMEFAGIEGRNGMGRTGMVVVLLLLPFIITNIFTIQNRAKAALACVLVSVALLMTPTVQMRIKDGANDMQLLQHNVTQTSLGYRTEMWKTAWGVFRSHPLLGAGPAGFERAWNSVPRDGAAKAFVEPHNAFLYYASSYGMLGLGALLCLYAAMLWTGWRQRQTMAGSIVLAFALVLVLSSFTNTIFMGAVSRAWLMLFVGLQGALLYRPEKTND